MKKLEETFNLPSSSDFDNETAQQKTLPVEDINQAMDIVEKIDHALKNVKGLDDHDHEMDDIAQRAIDSYETLMGLGVNVSDRDAAPIFDTAARMLGTALQARDSKVNTKLKQIDLMLKKARLDAQSKNNAAEEATSATVFDRNELLKMLKDQE